MILLLIQLEKLKENSVFVNVEYLWTDVIQPS